MPTNTPEARPADAREPVLAYFCRQWQEWRCEDCHQVLEGPHACTCDHARVREHIARLTAEVERLAREREEARTLVAEANNSLYGSHAYFHSLNGDPFNAHHLAEGIERLKADARRAVRAERERDRAQVEVAYLSGALEEIACGQMVQEREEMIDYAADRLISHMRRYHPSAEIDRARAQEMRHD